MLNPDDGQITRLLRALIDSATEHAYILLRPNGEILWCNEGAERLFAVPKQQLIGSDFRVIFTAEDRAAGIDELEQSIARAEAIAEDDRWHVRADGSRFWSSGALLPIRDEHGELLALGKIVRDRTDVKTQLELLSNRVERMRGGERDKDRAITTLVHELRNVVAGLQGSVELLETRFDDAERRATFAHLMQQQLTSMKRLMDDLLEVKRAQTQKISLALEPIELQALLRTMASKVEQRLRDAQLTLQLLAPQLGVVVHADSVRLHQIFNNLLDNAIKYTPPNGRIWVKITTEDRYAVVYVEDTGRGIPGDRLEDIFQLFTQVDTKASVGGLGVGLALVRELALLHRGSVQAYSKGIGQGSEFSVRLPLYQPPA